MAAWAVAALFAVTLSCRADVEVAVRSADQEAAPGALVTPVFAVTNAGAAETNVLLQFVAPTGWQVLGAQDSIFLLPDEEGTVFATVAVPADALAGNYELEITAISESDPDDRATGAARISVEAINAIELDGPIGTSAAPGSVVEYEIVLANRGTAQDSIRLTLTSSRQFPLDIREAILDLAPQERATIPVALTVPLTASPGQDVLTVRAVSTLYDGVEDEAVVFTTILPPTPDAVGGTMMEILPARLRLSIDKDALDGTFDSRLVFSTSGRVLDGFFSSYVSATDPLGPDPVDVSSYSILYRRKPATAQLGNLSKRLTDLVSLSCEGGSFDVDDDLLDVIVVGGFSGDEARFGGHFALGPEVANVGLTFFDARTPTSRRAIGGTTVEAEPLEDWRIFIEGALGTDDGITSHAFLFGTQIDAAGYFLDGRAFSVGTDFPGTDSDTAGIRLSQRLRLPDLSLSLSLAHEWDNVVRNPLASTQIEDSLGFNLRATPMEDGPTLTSTLEFEWAREDDPTQMSEIDLVLSAGMRETTGVFPYSFSGEIDDQIDLAFGSHTRTLTFREGAGLSVDSFYLFLQLTQEKNVDVLTGTVLSGETDVSILFRPEGTLHEASISLGNTVDSFDLSASLFIRFLESLDIIFDGTIGWDRADAEPVSFDWGITFNADLNVPLPFLVTKGRIEGRLFIDLDEDGVYGANDRPIGGAILAANRTEVSTDDEGLFRFPPLRGGDYPLEVRGLPAEAASPEPITAHVEAGELTSVPIPLAPVLTVDGVVFEDLDQDGIRDLDEGGFADVRVLLLREDGAAFAALTNEAGAFSFVGVLPGEYAASLDPATLPARFAFTTPESLDVRPMVASPASVEFSGYIRPRQVIVAIQPPTADFTFSPDAPAAGAAVTFDGTLSLDFDGEIVAYVWDFDGDGEEDAAGPTVDWTFPAPGAYTVSLTVADDEGSQDTLTLTINVVGAGPTPDVIIVSSIQPPIADFSYEPETPRVGEAVAFDGSLSVDFDGEIASYAWDFGADGVVDATGPTVLHVFSAAGTCDVSLTVADDGGNTDMLVQSVDVLSTAAPVDVRPTLEPPTASFSYAPGLPIAGEPITFDASPSSDPDGQIVSFSWDFDADGAADATGPIVEHAFADPGTYLVALTVADDGGATGTVSHTIDVSPPSPGDEEPATILPPIADFSYSPDAPVAGEPVEFIGLLSFDFDGEIDTYAWDFDDNGVVDDTGAIVLHAFASAGTYRVRLTVTDDDGATDSIVRTIQVE